MTGPTPSLRPAPTEGVLRALAGLEVPWALVRHADLAEPVRSPADVARQLSIDLGSITKTLLVTGRPIRAGFALAVLPVDARLDAAALGAVLDWGQVVLASPEELAAQMAQPAGGVSPLGSPLDVVVEETLLARPHVLVGAGRPGFEIEIDPRALVEATGGRVAPIVESGSRAGVGRADTSRGA